MRNQFVKDIDKLDGHQFEDLVEKLIKKMGFMTDEQKRAADGGIDIKAFNEQPLFKGKYIIQCKRYSKPIGESIIRDLYGVVTAENANKGILISNSAFTKAAMDFAGNKPLELISGRKLISLLDKHLSIKADKNGSDLVVPEVYIVTEELMGNLLSKIIQRSDKVKEGLVFLERKSFEYGKSYGEYIMKKLKKLGDLTKVLGTQFNYLNKVWQSTSDNEVYQHIREIKNHVREIISTLNMIEQEWEGLISIEPSDYYKESHIILCGMYETIINNINQFHQKLSEVVNNPEKFIGTDGLNINLEHTLSLDGKDEEFNEAFKIAVQKEYGKIYEPFSLSASNLSSDILKMVKHSMALLIDKLKNQNLKNPKSSNNATRHS